jgi:hypothetical protein
VSGNTDGAGIMNYGGALTLIHTTVYGNMPNPNEGGGGIISTLGSVTRLKNTIVASNGPADCVGQINTILSLGYNLASDGSCAFANTTDMNATNPAVSPLANNGGRTLTHNPSSASSPVLNKVPAADCKDTSNPPASILDDQRGLPRPMPSSGNCDIGSVEFQ